MKDLISRQAAIDRAVSIPMFGRDVKMVAVSEIKNLPSAQPKERTEERTETHACDLISRQAAIDAILAIKDYGNSDRANALGLAECAVTTLPSAQPEQIARDISTIIENEKDMRVILNAPSAQSEIIRCKDCMHNGSYDTDCPIDWNGKEYCSFAERKEDE